MQSDVTTSPFTKLPNEIVSLIITYLCDHQNPLYECALVSKSLHHDANALLWKTINLPDADLLERFITCISKTTSLRLYESIRNLRLTGLHWTVSQLMRLLPYLSHVNELYIENDTNITYECLQLLTSQCQQLVRLVIHWIELPPPFYSALRQSCHHLNDLHLKLLLDESIESLAFLTPCPSLEHLDLFSLGMHFNEREVVAIQQFNHLTHLNIRTGWYLVTGSDSDIMNCESTNALVQTTTTIYWPLLANIMFTCCNLMNDTLFIGFIKSHTHLQDIVLIRPFLLTNSSLHAMADWLTNLTRLKINGNDYISALGLLYLARKCSCLESINPISCPKVAPKHLGLGTGVFNTVLGIKLNRQDIGRIRREVI